MAKSKKDIFKTTYLLEQNLRKNWHLY